MIANRKIDLCNGLELYIGLMKFCIYQINLDRDTDRVAFEDLENLQRFLAQVRRSF